MEILGFPLEDIRNTNEELVITKFNKLLAEFPEFCGCRDCVEDVYALSLNSLPPHYRQPRSMIETDEIGEVKKYEDGVEKKVRESIKKVIKSPHH